MRRTKIVITLGPSTSSYKSIKSLIIKGVNVFRLNFSHGDYKTHQKNIKKIRKASRKLSKEVAILQDISGPKVRIGIIDGVLRLKKDEEIVLSKKKDEKDDRVLDITYPDIINMVEVGNEVFFSDGTIRTTVVKKENSKLHLKLLNDGELTSNKGVNFPSTKLSISAIEPSEQLAMFSAIREGYLYKANICRSY